MSGERQRPGSGAAAAAGDAAGQDSPSWTTNASVCEDVAVDSAERSRV